MNVNGVLTEVIVKMINDHVNHTHVFNGVNIDSIDHLGNYHLGICINTSMTNFTCNCNPGYEGKQCERMVNLCANVTCQNRGVCTRQLLNYTCKCLAGFSGRYCEITSTSTLMHTYTSKSNSNRNIIFIFPFQFLLYVFVQRFCLYRHFNVAVINWIHCYDGCIKICIWY